MLCPCGGDLEPWTAVGAIEIHYVTCGQCGAQANARMHPRDCVCAECDGERFGEDFHSVDGGGVTCDWCYQHADTPEERRDHVCPPSGPAVIEGKEIRSPQDLPRSTPGIVFYDEHRLNATLIHDRATHRVKLPDRFVGEGHDLQEAILFVLIARSVKLEPRDLDLLQSRSVIDAIYRG